MPGGLKHTGARTHPGPEPPAGAHKHARVACLTAFPFTIKLPNLVFIHPEAAPKHFGNALSSFDKLGAC